MKYLIIFVIIYSVWCGDKFPKNLPKTCKDYQFHDGKLYTYCNNGYDYWILGQYDKVNNCTKFLNCNGFFVCSDSCDDYINKFHYSLDIIYDGGFWEVYGPFRDSCNHCYVYKYRYQDYLSCNCKSKADNIYYRSSIDWFQWRTQNCHGFLNNDYRYCPEASSYGYTEDNCCPFLPGDYFDNYSQCYLVENEILKCWNGVDRSSMNITHCPDIKSSSYERLYCLADMNINDSISKNVNGWHVAFLIIILLILSCVLCIIMGVSICYWCNINVSSQYIVYQSNFVDNLNV